MSDYSFKPTGHCEGQGFQARRLLVPKRVRPPDLSRVRQRPVRRLMRSARCPGQHAVNDGITVSLSGLSLTGEDAKVYSDLPDRPVSLSHPGERLALGTRAWPRANYFCGCSNRSRHGIVIHMLIDTCRPPCRCEAWTCKRAGPSPDAGCRFPPVSGLEKTDDHAGTVSLPTFRQTHFVDDRQNRLATVIVCAALNPYCPAVNGK